MPTWRRLAWKAHRIIGKRTIYCLADSAQSVGEWGWQAHSIWGQRVIVRRESHSLGMRTGIISQILLSLSRGSPES